MIQKIVWFVCLHAGNSEKVLLNPVLKDLKISPAQIRDLLREITREGFIVVSGSNEFESLGITSSGVAYNLDTLNLYGYLGLKGKEMVLKEQNEILNWSLNLKKHQVLRFLNEQASEAPEKQTFSDYEISQKVFFNSLNIPQVRTLLRKLGEDGVVRLCPDKDSFDIGFIQTTEEAYYSEKYLTAPTLTQMTIPQNVYNSFTTNINGNNNPTNIAAGLQVEQTNFSYSVTELDKLKLKSLGVDDIQITELEKIIKENTKNKGILKEKAKKWLEAVSISLVTKGITESIPEVAEFIQTIVL